MPRFRPAAAFVLAAAALCALALPRAQAQAIPTATKTYAIDVFGGVTAGNPKFGVTTHEIGYTFGGDLTRQFRFANVSLEARYTSITGFSADEKTFGGGIKLSRTYFRRVHPYIDFMLADGKIHFDHPEIYGTGAYTDDSSTVYLYGGGIDYDVLRSFALKVDFQGSRWNVGIERQPFNPYTGTVGIVYTIPFRALRGR